MYCLVCCVYRDKLIVLLPGGAAAPRAAARAGSRPDDDLPAEGDR